MKMVKKSITLQEDVLKFAEQQAKELARERAEQPNLSAYMRELLLAAKRRSELKKAA